jgi:hypothetical protein
MKIAAASERVQTTLAHAMTRTYIMVKPVWSLAKSLRGAFLSDGACLAVALGTLNTSDESASRLRRDSLRVLTLSEGLCGAVKVLRPAALAQGIRLGQKRDRWPAQKTEWPAVSEAA